MCGMEPAKPAPAGEVGEGGKQRERGEEREKTVGEMVKIG